MSLHLSPSKNHRFQWNDTNFHSSLLQKMWSSNSLMLLFQAKARESISVALSPVADYSKELFYEIQFGAVGNTTTNIRRKQNKKQQQHVSIPSRVCKDESWISYWVCLQEQKVYAGMGEIPGENCIGVLEEKQQPEVTKVEKEQDGGGDDSKVVEENEESNMDAVVATPTDTTLPTIQYVGLGNCARGPKSQALSVQKVVLTTISPTVADKLRDLPEDLPTVVVDDEEGREMIKLMEEYRKECEIRKSRAEKFGTQYKQPARDEFIPWSKAKRLRENPEKGFITGIDLMDSDEVAKREARKARFGVVDNTDGDNEKEDEEGEGKKKGKDLPVSEAWDKEAMLRPQRKDPPSSMWNQPPSESSMEERDNFAMEQPEPTTLVPEKIHLFAIDWAAFKQIRNKDIMVSIFLLLGNIWQLFWPRTSQTHGVVCRSCQAYFSTYGPSYVEWLADLSCNVCFEDKYTASRAMMNLSQEIPTPPSESIKVDDDQPPDFGNMNWRFCRRPIRKVRLILLYIVESDHAQICA